ncbi:unnamed protein product [Gordionus sp. m RMFG-2023]
MYLQESNLTTQSKYILIELNQSTNKKILIPNINSIIPLLRSYLQLSIINNINITSNFNDLFVLRSFEDRRRLGLLTAVEQLDFENRYVIYQRQALIYIVVVISFYAATIIIVMIKYMKAEKMEMKESQQYLEYRKLYERRPKQRQKQKWINYLRKNNAFLLTSKERYLSSKRNQNISISEVPDIIVE